MNICISLFLCTKITVKCDRLITVNDGVGWIKGFHACLLLKGESCSPKRERGGCVEPKKTKNVQNITRFFYFFYFIIVSRH
mmetsp:Transcript_558/g.559  ORF Transcript_558/g.559 Transcript_558/m.559 type:complete len:81 (+) Transcript_558:557-799(+)